MTIALLVYILWEIYLANITKVIKNFQFRLIPVLSTDIRMLGNDKLLLLKNRYYYTYI